MRHDFFRSNRATQHILLFHFPVKNPGCAAAGNLSQHKEHEHTKDCYNAKNLQPCFHFSGKNLFRSL